MLVRDRMTRHPVTIAPDTLVADALDFMRQNQVRRLPVLDNGGQLVGIVSEKDLLYASPSEVTSLSVYEVSFLLHKLKVEEIMTRDVITVEDESSLEDAARLMVEHRIGGLPVMRDGRLVGIVTETDLFKVFLEMLGAHEQGLRISLSLPHRPRALETLVNSVSRGGGDIVSLGTFYGEDRDHETITMKVRGVTKAKLLERLEQVNVEVLDIRGQGH